MRSHRYFREDFLNCFNFVRNLVYVPPPPSRKVSVYAARAALSFNVARALPRLTQVFSALAYSIASIFYR